MKKLILILLSFILLMGCTIEDGKNFEAIGFSEEQKVTLQKNIDDWGVDIYLVEGSINKVKLSKEPIRGDGRWGDIEAHDEEMTITFQWLR